MTTPTTNPVPSNNPNDLLFNAEQFDVALNSTAASYKDRLGVVRRTVKGQFDAVDAELAEKLDDAQSQINVKVDEAAASAADAADSALEALGYLQTYRATSYGALASDPATDPLGNPPTVGDEYFNTTANLLKRWNGTTWQASDINTANLAAPSGSSLVGYDGGTVQDVLDGAKSMQSYTALRNYTGRATGVRITTPGISGFFQRLGTVGLTDNGGTVIIDALGRAWERLFDGEMLALWFGALGNGSADDMLALQAAMNAAAAAGRTLIIPKTTTGIYVVGAQTSLYCLSAPNNLRLIIQPGVTIKAKSLIGDVVRILSIANATNVFIRAYGAYVAGLKAEYTTGEQRHGVIISSSKDVIIDGLTSKDTGGDGFYIGAGTCENVTLNQCTANNNRRNGCSVTSGKRITLDACNFTNNNGISPQAGLDIEPNSNADFMEDILVRNCYAAGNAGSGFIVAPFALPGAETRTLSITLVDCVDDRSNGGFQVGGISIGTNKVTGKITFSRCTSRNSLHGGFGIRNYDDKAPPIFMDDCTVIDPVSIGYVTAARYDAPFSVYAETSDTGTHNIGNVHVTRPTIKYSGTPVDVVDFHFRCLRAGNNVNNVHVIDPVEVGHPGTANRNFQANFTGAKNCSFSDPREFYTHIGTEVLQDYYFGTTFKSESNALSTFTLGAKQIGYPDQTFEVMSVFGLTITPDASSEIQPIGAAGKSIQSTKIGASIVLRRNSATSWRVVRQIGTWTALP